MAKSTSNITIKLLLFLLLLSGEALAQTTTIRGGTSPETASVTTTTPAADAPALVIRCASGCAGSGGTSATDKEAFTASTTLGTPAMGAMDDAASSTCGEDQACITRMTANRAIHVNLRDAAGNELSVGGGTQYAQGTAATDTDTMNMLGCERADTAAAQTGVANGDRANCLVDATQRLYTHVGTIDGGTITSITNPVAVTGTFWQATQPVSQSGTFTVQPGNTANTTPWLTTISQGGNAAVVNGSGQLSITCANCSGSGASAVDDAAFTVATDSGAPAMGLFDDVAPDSVNEGDAGVLRMSANRNLYSTIRDAAGNERGANVNASNELLVALSSVPSHAVTNAGTFATQAAQSGTWNINNISGAISLPTGAATAAKQPALGTAGTASTDVITVQGIASMTALKVDGSAVTQPVSMATNTPVGNVAHDAADSGAPIKVGGKAIAHGANPTAVAAADRTDWYFSRAGIPFVVGGHPNSKTIEAQVEDGDGAQTNAAIVTVAAGNKIVVTRLTATCDASNTGPTNAVVGFGTASIPARSHSGAVGILHGFDGIPAGSGFTIGDGHGILGIGADGEDLRFTMEAPAGGSCSVSATYYTVES